MATDLLEKMVFAVPDTPAELLGEDDLGIRCRDLLGYRRAVGLEGSSALISRVIKVLAELEVPVFTPASVSRYKAREWWRTVSRRWANLLFLIGPSILSLAWFAARDGAPQQFYGPLIIVGIIGGIFSTVGALATATDWAWQREWIGIYNRDIPVAALRIACRVQEAMLREKIACSMSIESLVRRRTVHRDPFLVLTLEGSDTVFHLAVWNEPRFSANLTA